jgi:hypothetical protein
MRRHGQGLLEPAPALPVDLHLHADVSLAKALAAELCPEYCQLRREPVIGLMGVLAGPWRVRRRMGVETSFDASLSGDDVRIRRGGRGVGPFLRVGPW